MEKMCGDRLLFTAGQRLSYELPLHLCDKIPHRNNLRREEFSWLRFQRTCGRRVRWWECMGGAGVGERLFMSPQSRKQRE